MCIYLFLVGYSLTAGLLLAQPIFAQSVAGQPAATARRTDRSISPTLAVAPLASLPVFTNLKQALKQPAHVYRLQLYGSIT